MRVFIYQEKTTVGEAPVGLLLLDDGELICKSEYRMPGPDAQCDCTIVSSGEHYCGQGDKALCRPVIVQ